LVFFRFTSCFWATSKNDRRPGRRRTSSRYRWCGGRHWGNCSSSTSYPRVPEPDTSILLRSCRGHAPHRFQWQVTIIIWSQYE